MNMCCMQNYMNSDLVLHSFVSSLCYVNADVLFLLPSALKWTCTCLWRSDRSQSASTLPDSFDFQTKQQPRSETTPVESLRASQAAAPVLSLSDTCYMNSVCLRGTNESQKHQIEAVTDGSCYTKYTTS